MTTRRHEEQLELPHVARAGEVALPTALSRRSTQRGRAATASAAPRPWLCVVLAVDTARRSGWAIAANGAHVDSGEVDTRDEATLEQIVANAVELGVDRGLVVVLVLEAPWGGRADIVAALGATRERWLRAWRQREQAHARVVLVLPNTWRGPVLGRKWVSVSRERVREHEQRVASALLGHAVGEDEAPAVLIARWAAHAARVGRAIGKRAAKASLRAWTRAL